MNTAIAITDLTRMYQGRVCLAGYDQDRRCIRPVLPPPGIPESALMDQGRPVIFPFALVAFDLLQPDPQPPHTEDYFFAAGSQNYIRTVKNREELLKWSLFESVEAIFEQQVHTGPGFYVMDCQGPRSVGTIQPHDILKAIYEPGPEGVWDYRLLFKDGQDETYRLKITDLTWHYYCDSLKGEHCDATKIAARLDGILKSSKVYLRIGLARGWKKFPDRCFLQINGIYTFPDYLIGQTFADFRTGRNNN